MESSTIMGEPSPHRARFIEKLAAAMAEGALPAHLLRLVLGVRLLPKNPPPHAVALAVVTAAVLGAATGVVLAIAAPAPEASVAPPAAMVTLSFTTRPAEVVHPSALAVRLPDSAAVIANAAAEATEEVPAPAPSTLTVAQSPPSTLPILPVSPILPVLHPTPRATATRISTARNTVAQANIAASPLSRGSAGSGEGPPLAAAGPSAVTPPPLEARARPNEGTADDSSAAEELIWLTERAFQSGHPAEAVRLGKKALAAHGGARAHLALAAAYFDLRRFDDARASYEAVLQTEPDNQAARIGLDLAKTAQARAPEPVP